MSDGVMCRFAIELSDQCRGRVALRRQNPRLPLCFNRDGSFKGEVVYHAKLISKFTGRWSVDGDALLYTYISDELDRIPAGATDRDKLLSVHREFFIIEAADGSKRKYLRVR